MSCKPGSTGMGPCTWVVYFCISVFCIFVFCNSCKFNMQKRSILLLFKLKIITWDPCLLPFGWLALPQALGWLGHLCKPPKLEPPYDLPLHCHSSHLHNSCYYTHNIIIIVLEIIITITLKMSFGWEWSFNEHVSRQHSQKSMLSTSFTVINKCFQKRITL